MKSARHAARMLRAAIQAPHVHTAIYGACLFFCCIAATGCDRRTALDGLVTNIDGEPLPGVSVKVSVLQVFGVSNGNGIFGKRPNTISVPPGTWELEYIKSGFTTARQSVTAGKEYSIEVPPVSLWPLPAAKGVYVLDNLRYEPLTRVTPERYIREDNSVVFGVKVAPELKLPAPPELIISHKMASYDWQLSRLEPVNVIRPGVLADTSAGSVPDSLKESVWAAAVRLPIQAAPVDQPEQLLWRIKPAAPMGPGIYAVHWGALDGDTTTEEFAYLMKIADPNEAPATPDGAAQEPPEGAARDAAPEAKKPAADQPAAE